MIDDNQFSLPVKNDITSKDESVAALRVVWDHSVQVY